MRSTVISAVFFCALFIAIVLGGSETYGQPLAGGGAASGADTAKRLQSEKAGKNAYRVDMATGIGGVKDEAAVLANMQRLFQGILVDPANPINPSKQQELDSWFSPHLRDAEIHPGLRTAEVLTPYYGRVWAGTTHWTLWGCDGACPGCRWHDSTHASPSCCGKSTWTYAPLVTDTNFKACCVREKDRCSSMEEIACSYPMGDGWAGLFEYYFPTNVIGWEPQRATTMIASDRDVQRCLNDSDLLMENSKWVADAIQKGAQVSDGSIQGKAQDSMKAIRPKDQSLRFSDTLRGGGLTMRVNFAHMDPAQRVALAREFCMHDDQFMKLMNPRYDPLQKLGTGGSTLADLQNTERIPIWADYCPSAVKLMTDVNETRKIVNVDRTPTDFVKGMRAWDADPLYCQKMNVSVNPTAGEFLKNGVLAKQGLSLMTEAGVGYTCRVGDGQKGGFSTRMVPVELNSTASIDPRTLDHAIPFMIAAGYYPWQLFNGFQSVYKRFEPRPYTQSYPPGSKLFVGKRWSGPGLNENYRPCRVLRGRNLTGKDVSDQLYISDANHQLLTKDRIVEGDGSNTPGFNRYDREWAGKNADNFHNRNFNQQVMNYGAAFRAYATCPAGYVRWKGPHSEMFDAVCGEENFGGRTPPSPPCASLFGGH